MATTYDLVVAHYHEVGLKGRNRGFFERRLVENLRTALAGIGVRSVRTLPGRIVAWLEPNADVDGAVERMSRIFGLAHFAPAVRTDPSMEALCSAAIALSEEAEFESFAVRARKSSSKFAESGHRVNEVVGQALVDLGRKVDLDNPDWTCHIEIIGGEAFVYGARHEGPGGLPVGTAGKVVTLLSGGIDSPVAAWEMSKRGVRHELIHFHGQPFTDPSSVRQATRLAEALAPWLQEARLWLIPFGDLQSEIVTSAPAELRVVLYRRFMMRIAERLAEQEGAEALVTGESLGQVASQTLPNIRAISDVVDLPVLRPLIGRDKIEIERLAKSIGTYEISIDPHQDCCVLFVPRQVTTHASIEELEEAEKSVDVQALVEKGLANAQTETVRP